jgi:uncharacterized protein YqeY
MNTNTIEYEKSILKKIEGGITETMSKKAAIHNGKEASPEGFDKELAIALLDRRAGTLKLIKSELIRANEKNYHTNLEYKMTENEEVKVLMKMAEDHKANIEGYKKVGNTEMLNQEKGELSVIEEFIPAQPTEEEMTEFVNSLIDNLIAEKGDGYILSQKDMGVLMPQAKAKYPNINGNIVKSALTAKMS